MKMKKIFHPHIIGCLLAVAALASCTKKFITKAPDTSLLTSQALGTPAALSSALNGAYNQLGQVGVFGRDLPVVGDVMADNVYVQSKNSNRYISQYNYSVTSQDQIPADVWTQTYAVIVRVNQIIDSKLTGKDVDPIKAQALALRALSYFKLVTYFAQPYSVDSAAPGVPLVLHYDPFGEPARNSVGTVFNQIVADLNAAMVNAPDYSNSVTISHFAIEGLLARAYLYMGNYQGALTAATDVINHGGFTLVDSANLVGFWSDPTVKSDNVEVLFEINQDVLVNNGFDDLGGIYYNGYADLYCSSQLYNLYSPTDARIQLIDPTAKTATGATAYGVLKFPNAGSADKDNLKVIRLAEVYLIGAEAAARLGGANTAIAQGWMNDLRDNRDPSAPDNLDAGATLINDIILERRKELAFEGDRFFDLNRLKLPIVRGANPQGLSLNANNTTIPFPDNRRVAPIPNAEIQANPNIAKQQNPGY
jgi:hypothetical protein